MKRLTRKELNMWCAISDIHGQYDQLLALEALVEREHPGVKFIYDGDYVDRGPKADKVLEHIKQRVEAGHVAVIGNHDLFLLEYLIGEYVEYPRQFGRETIQQLAPGLPLINDYDSDRARDFILKHHTWIKPFLESLPLFHEEGSTIFIHGGFNPYRSDFKDSTDTEMTMPSFLMPMHAGLYPEKQFVFGHVHARDYHRDEQNCSPYKKLNFTFIDGASVSGGQLNGYMSDGRHYFIS